MKCFGYSGRNGTKLTTLLKIDIILFHYQIFNSHYVMAQILFSTLLKILKMLGSKKIDAYWTKDFSNI